MAPQDRHYEVLSGSGAEGSGAGVGAPGGRDVAFRYRLDRVAWDDRFRDSMWRFWRLLPLEPPADGHVTLGEGGTPLLPSRLYRDHRVWLKDETRNPTGSHKDRALALGINHALACGAGVSAVVSAGSTGISHAAYAARAGLRSLTLMSSGTPPERVYPVHGLGSEILEIDADIDAIIHHLEAIGPGLGIYLNSTTRMSNAYQAEAAKTIAYEVAEAFGGAPDWIVVPVGGGGTVAAIHKGFAELEAMGRIDGTPRLLGVVPRRFNALEVAFREGVASQQEYDDLPPVVGEATVLTKLAHGRPPDGFEALTAIRQSDGFVLSVDDEEAMEGQLRIARAEGLYVEPSSGVVAPAVDRLLAHPAFGGGSVAVLLCGSGFRETFVSLARRPMQPRRLRLDDLAATLGALLAP